MASGPGAVSDDPNALKHDIAVMSNASDDNDATSALTNPTLTVLSASAEPVSAGSQAAATTSERESHEETRAATSVTARFQSKPAAQHASTGTTTSDPSSNSDGSDAAMGPVDVADASITFAFPNMGSNQPDELFDEQLGECTESSGETAPRRGDEGNDLSRAARSAEPADGERVQDAQQRAQVNATDDQMEHLEQQHAGSVAQSADAGRPGSLSGIPPPTLEQQQSDMSSRSCTQYPPEASGPPKYDSTSAVASSGVSKRPAPLSTTPVQPWSWNDILLVQNMIERCLQQYLNKTEIFQVLKDQAQVDPEFTNVVWQKLHEQNPSFFRAYGILLQLKEQILAFNYLVAQQKEVMQSGSRISPLTGTPLPPLLQVDTRVFVRDPTGADSKLPSNAAQQTLSATHLQQQQQQQSQALATVPFGSGSAHSSSTALSSSDNFLPSPLPLPSPIKTDLDTHAFFT